MDFNECKTAIIQYIINYDQGKESLIPCIEVFQHVFKNTFSRLELEECARGLVSSEILEPYSFHGYLKLTETFKSRIDYNILKKLKYKER